LQILKISTNNINVLEKVNFQYLKELHLISEKIDISVLEKVKFENWYNMLSKNIKYWHFRKSQFKKLKYLKLRGMLSDLKFLENVKFDNLTTLLFYDIKNTDISSLETTNFKELKELHLCSNKFFNKLTPLSKN